MFVSRKNICGLKKIQCNTYSNFNSVSNDLDLIQVSGVPKCHITKVWSSGISLVLINLFITIPLCLLFSTYFFPVKYLLPGTFMWHYEIVKVVIYILLADMWFFFLHYFAHTKYIYSYVHKLHHKYTAPVAINALYANPIDFGIISIMSICIGPILIAGHIYTLIIYTFGTILINSISHSGYNIIAMSSHDTHHQYFNCNYGYGVFMDKLFKTTYTDKCFNNQISI
jgi:sterol desaturase/sphingolipid hydroxylase (fatty acid hydroxylase superfamily)